MASGPHPGFIARDPVMNGWPRADEPCGAIELVLDQPSTLEPDKDLRDGLSAVARDGPHLWLANDETTSLERLTIRDDRANSHLSFDLTGVLDLPDDGGEIDIEGLDVVGDALWLVGSHSAVRKRVKDEHDPASAQSVRGDGRGRPKSSRPRSARAERASRRRWRGRL